METAKTKDWADCEREDLKAIPMMREEGFSVEFHYQDRINQRMTPELMPIHPVSFSRGDLRVWQTRDYKNSTMNWTVAEIVNGHYTGHRTIKSLNDL